MVLNFVTQTFGEKKDSELDIRSTRSGSCHALITATRKDISVVPLRITICNHEVRSSNAAGNESGVDPLLPRVR